MTITEEQQQASEGGAGVPTVASRARDWARTAPNQVAYREKDFGIWNEYTWADSWEMIENAANGLLAFGVQPGDRVAIHSEDRLEWIIMDLATVAVRGVTVGFYPTNPTAEVEYLLTDCGACIHFAEDQEQYDKVVEIGRGDGDVAQLVGKVPDRFAKVDGRHWPSRQPSRTLRRPRPWPPAACVQHRQHRSPRQEASRGSPRGLGTPS